MKIFLKYPKILLIIGICALMVGVYLPINNSYDYYTSVLLAGLGGLSIGISSRVLINKYLK